MSSPKNKILILCAIIATLAVLFVSKPFESEKKSDVLTEDQIQRQSEEALDASEATVKIPTHHSDGERKQ